MSLCDTSPAPVVKQVMIDHQAFPHIVDLIWRHMPYPALLVARRVCREWKLQAEERLWQHVVLAGERATPWVRERDLWEVNSWETVDDDASDAANEVLEQAASAVDELLVTSYDSQHPDMYAELLSSLDTAAFQLGPKVNGTNTVIDMLQDAFAFPDNSDLADCITTWGDVYDGHIPIQPAVVRWHATPGVPTFASLPMRPTEAHVTFFSYTTEYILPTVRGAMSHKTVVLNFDCYSDPTAPLPDIQPLRFFDVEKPKFETYTLIFRDRIGSKPPPKAPEGAWKGQSYEVGLPHDWESWLQCTEVRPLGLVHEVLRLAHSLNFLNRINIVGVEQFVAPIEEGQMSYLEKLKHLAGQHAEQISDSAYHSAPNKLRGMIRFMSHEEYKLEVGKKTYCLHTVR